MIDVGAILKEDAAEAERILEHLLSEKVSGTGRLQDAMRYSVLGGGKRIRACLALEFCKLFSGNKEKALYFAAAIEMIHAYSLIHDDMPCMDDDDMRRGKPSCHAAFGEATALLAGDTLLSYAFEVIAKAPGVSDAAARQAVISFAALSGHFGMTGGQMMDEENTADTYEAIVVLHNLKTSALINAAALSGYLSTLEGAQDPEIVSDIKKYSECFGLAFQLKDDLLDLEGDASVIGKKTGVDQKNDRKNSLSFMTPDEARVKCERHAETAKEIIEKYPGSEFLASLPGYLNGRNK